jgi:hypothetical protein
MAARRERGGNERGRAHDASWRNPPTASRSSLALTPAVTDPNRRPGMDDRLIQVRPPSPTPSCLRVLNPDAWFLQELRATRHQLNAHLLELRDELSRVRASMQRAAPPQLVVQDELGRYSDGRPVANQLAVGQGSSPRRLPSPMGSPTLLPSPTSPRAASTLHLPPGPRFPLNPTAGRSGTPSTSSPPPPSSALADLLELVQDERAPAGRAFEPARATRGSVRLLSRGPDGSQAAGPSNGSTADAWVIPIYPFSEARAEAIMVAQPAQGPSVETRIAGSVPEATGPGSLTTRRTSETRTRFPQSGSAAVSLLFGSGARDGPWGDDPESDARRNVGDLRAAFLPRTVNIPPISSERGQANSTVGSDDGSAAVSGSNRSRPRPTPPPGASSYASGSRPPQRQPSLTAGELDPNGETFDRLQSALPAHTASGARQTPIEPSVWTLLPVRPPLLSSFPPFPIETVSPSSAPAFGAPSFDRDSSEAQRRFDRTSGLLEDLQQRRERLRFNIAALRGSGSRDLPGVDDSSSVSDDPQPTVAPGNLRPPEQSTPVSSPALQHRSVSARLLEALGGEGLGDIGRRLAREERENAVAGSQWDGWASFTGTSSWDDADGPPATGGIRSSPPTVPTDADLRNAPRRTRSVLRAYLQQGSAPSADLEARLLRAEQEDAARATRLPPSQEAGGSRLPASSRRNAPWLLGDGGSQTSTTETRSGDEARFWVRSPCST